MKATAKQMIYIESTGIKIHASEIGARVAADILDCLKGPSRDLNKARLFTAGQSRVAHAILAGDISHHPKFDMSFSNDPEFPKIKKQVMSILEEQGQAV